MTYKLISADVDGTLAPYRKTISKETHDAMNELIQQGVIIVPNTGRARIHFDPYFLSAGIQYLILSNGARIIDLKTNAVIYEEYIPVKTASQVYEKAISYGLDICAFIGDYMMQDTVYLKDDPKGSPEKYKTPCPNLDVCINNGTCKVHKYVMYVNPEKKKQYLFEFEKLFPELTFTSSVPFNIEATTRNANKGIGIIKLCNHLNISTNEVIAMGDSDNDLPMFQVCGYTVAPKNASETIKEIADRIIDSCEENGAASFFKELTKKIKPDHIRNNK